MEARSYDTYPNRSNAMQQVGEATNLQVLQAARQAGL
jgi:hypothetical protein